MTKKKRGHPTAEEVLARPWCYYCERDFDDLKILHSHQKAKHFKCERCGRRLNTAGGLSVHMSQVHKETLEAVENALPNRLSTQVEIFGMEGIPQEAVEQHNQRVLAQFHQAEADRRAATGNPPPGGAGGSIAKKPKVEDTGDLKARLAAFKAKKAAAAQATSSGDVTPTGAGQPTPAREAPQSPAPFPAQYPSVASPTQHAFPQPFGGPSYASSAQQQPPYPQSHSPFNQGPPGFPPPQQVPPGMQHFQSLPQPPQYGVSSPPPGMFQQPHAQNASPVQNGPLARPPGLPAAPGLPQRPAFGAPQATPAQLQQMHQGQYPAQAAEENISGGQDPRVQPSISADGQATATEAEVDNLIANAAKQSGNAKPDETPTSEKTVEKKQKKDKDKPTRLVYEDNEVSPEEKMAKLSRYAFDPSGQEPETVLGDAGDAAVTGPVVGQDDVLDPQG